MREAAEYVSVMARESECVERAEMLQFVIVCHECPVANSNVSLSLAWNLKNCRIQAGFSTGSCPQYTRVSLFGKVQGAQHSGECILWNLLG
jgi:hypothetical protein